MAISGLIYFLIRRLISNACAIISTKFKIASENLLGTGKYVMLKFSAKVCAAASLLLISQIANADPDALVIGASSGDGASASIAASGDATRDGFADLALCAPNGSSIGTSDAVGIAYCTDSFSFSTTASEKVRVPAGLTRYIGLGGTLAPNSRAYVKFYDGAGPAGSACDVVSTTVRSNALISGFSAPLEVANTVWQLDTDRTSWSSASLRLRLRTNDFADANSTNPINSPRIYRSAGTAGLWDSLPSVFDAQRCLVTAQTTQTGTFVIAKNTDTTPPLVAVSAPYPSATNSGPIAFTVSYTDADIVTLSTGDVTVHSTGTATYSSVAVSGSGLASRTVTVSGLSGNGTLSIELASGTAADAAGNLAGSASSTSSALIDNVNPTVASISRAGGTPTRATTVNFTVTFSESVIGVAAANFAMTGSGVSASISTPTGSGTTWNVAVSSMVGVGTLGLNLNSTSGITDAAGNALAAGYTGPLYGVERPYVYVATTGSDTTGDGSVAYPFRTVQNGAQQVDLNGTVYVEQGQYNENVSVSRDLAVVGDSGTTGVPGAGNASPLIQGDGTGDALAVDSAVSATLVGLSISNTTTGTALRNNGLLNLSHNNLTTSSRGLYVEGGVTTATLNRFQGNGAGIVFAGGTLVATVNCVEGNTTGVVVEDVASDISTATLHINYNHIDANTSGGLNLATTGSLDTIYNWWGDASGPKADTNTTGVGNAVSGRVTFNPWYRQGNLLTTLNDQDGDGIVNADEDMNLNSSVDTGETNAALKDTDGDGFEDGVEFRYGSDPLSASNTPPASAPYNSTGDADGDRYKDLYEYEHGTDPSNSSSKPMLGDANGDGVVDNTDKTILSSLVVGTISPSDCLVQNLDLNRDGSITGSDSIILTRFVAGTIALLPTN